METLSANFNEITDFENVTAGQVYTPDQQCELIHGSESKLLRVSERSTRRHKWARQGEGALYMQAHSGLVRVREHPTRRPTVGSSG